MFLFPFVEHIIETVIEIYEIPLIWWVDPQYPWSQGIGSPILGSSMTRVNPAGLIQLATTLADPAGLIQLATTLADLARL